VFCGSYINRLYCDTPHFRSIPLELQTPADAPPLHLDHHPRFLAATCCLALFLFAVSFGAFSVLLPYIGKSYGLGSSVEGRLFPANFTGFAIAVLLCGALSDRYGRKAVLLVATAFYGIGLALFGYAPTFGTTLFAAGLVGAGSGAMETVASALAADLYPKNRAAIINGLQIAFGVGAGISPALAHNLLHSGIDWRTLYLSFSGATAILFLALAFQKFPRIAHAAEGLDIKAIRAMSREPIFLILCVSEALYVGSETGLFSWMPTYFERQGVSGRALSGIVVSVFWTTMTIGRIVTGALIGRVALLKLTILLGAGGAIAAALALVWSGPLVTMVFVGLAGFFFSGIFGLVLAEAGNRYPHVSGTVIGCVVASGGVGGAVFPWLIGALADTGTGWRLALGLVPVAMAGVALLTQRLRVLEARA